MREIRESGERKREKKRVFVLGGVRIFSDAIKKYGISSKKVYYENIYKKIICTREGCLPRVVGYQLTGNYKKISKDRYYECISNNTCDILLEDRYMYSHYAIFDSSLSTLEPDEFVFFEKERYLYINTYKKNYTFWENRVNFDIDQKCYEIDNWFNS